MEEVVGSIPTRSTKSLNRLDRTTLTGVAFVTWFCVVTRRFGARSTGFHRVPLRFHPHLTMAFKQAAAAVRLRTSESARWTTLNTIG